LRIIAFVFGHICHIDVVQRRQVVEVEAGILGDMGAVDEVANDATVVWYLIADAEGAIEVQRGRDAVRLRADAADALGDYLGITWVPAP
jgi:hypothetical protein